METSLQKMENTCLFVSERGYEFDITHKLFSIHDLHQLLNTIKEDDIVFCKSDFLPFLCEALPFIPAKFNLISGRGDYVVSTNTDSFFYPYLKDVTHYILESPKVLKWFAVNCLIPHKKLVPIPLGIDYHTLLTENNTIFENFQATPFEQEKILLAVKETLIPLLNTSSKCVANFHQAMDSPPARQRYRRPAYEILKDNDCVIWLQRQVRTDFWKSCNDHMFVLCPFGNGPDTHRTYEVLCLGRVPIIPDCYFNEFLFKDLPVVIIKDWKEITPEFLEEKRKQILENVQNNVYKYDRLYSKFWKNFIEAK